MMYVFVLIGWNPVEVLGVFASKGAAYQFKKTRKLDQGRLCDISSGFAPLEKRQ
jgi:hypothetical protein